MLKIPSSLKFIEKITRFKREREKERIEEKKKARKKCLIRVWYHGRVITKAPVTSLRHQRDRKVLFHLPRHDFSGRAS